MDNQLLKKILRIGIIRYREILYALLEEIPMHAFLILRAVFIERLILVALFLIAFSPYFLVIRIKCRLGYCKKQKETSPFIYTMQ